MREIKFNAWDERNKLMIKNIMSISSTGFPYFPYPIIPPYLKWLQFSGKRNKNNEEIYEGDLLNLIEPKIKGQQSEFGIVQVCLGEYDDSEIEYGSSGIGWYVKGFHGYNRINGKTDKYFIGINGESDWSLDRCLEWEIIGNIYENPEILKEFGYA